MTKFTSSLTIATLLALGLHAAPAHAQLSRTFVSAAIGNDANNCDRPTPCRTFQGAHNKTNPDGEIIVLDPGGYGGLTITKSISIVNDGVGEASILVSGGGTGITISAGAASYINLRGITIQGIGFGGGTGLRFNSGFSLTITNCVIRNHTQNGIQMIGNVPVNTKSTFILSNTLVSDNGGSGISVQPSGSGTLNVVLNRVELYNNSAHGFAMAGTAGVTLSATVTDSVSSNNGLTGFVTSRNNFAAYTIMKVSRSVAAFNANQGARADGQGAFMIISGNLMHDNDVTSGGLDWGATNAGAVVTYGDNVGSGNATSTATKQ